MSSRAGPRAQGTDGTDFLHRQRVAAHYHESANYKFILKLIFAAHLLVLFSMWTKVGIEVFRVSSSKLVDWLDLPPARPWCCSFVAIIFGLLALPKNKVAMIKGHYYAHFFLGILPCLFGMGTLVRDHFLNDNMLKFTGDSPMVRIWFAFFAVALPIHLFAMRFSFQLSAAWTPIKKTD